MATRAQHFLEKASACERAAGKANDPLIKQSFEQAARQWRRMAEEAAAFEARGPGSDPKPKPG
jgi:hypothetical protein